MNTTDDRLAELRRELEGNPRPLYNDVALWVVDAATEARAELVSLRGQLEAVAELIERRESEHAARARTADFYGNEFPTLLTSVELRAALGGA